ncbi:hypothetical protein EVAR_67516_1 [Eumeta japonica]|uniref:Uncharacterized protein n=1 Tax=Eumeta variegata TaxID=151549 RepID=A0A4C1YTE6_EUMVA|nr:hypothetical protein EVAR_67516_1 [Eumeta japonica]
MEMSLYAIKLSQRHPHVSSNARQNNFIADMILKCPLPYKAGRAVSNRVRSGVGDVCKPIAADARRRL